MIRHFSLFSGIESFKKAMTNLGIENELVGYSEFDKYASVTLAAIHGVDESLNYGDITKIDETLVPDCDLISYGFPCQDISIAGHQRGIIEGETRSGLLFDALRIIKHKMPKYAIAENVKNLVGKKFKDDFNSLLEELESYGYTNYYKVLNAKDYGIPQNRERVFIVSVRKDIDDGKFEFPKPYDSGLRLKDLLEDEVEDKYYIDNDRTSILLNNLKEQDLLNGERFGADSTINDTKKREISNCITARYDTGIQNQKQIGLVVAEPKVAIRETTNEPKRLGGLFDSEERKRQAGAVRDKECIAPTIDTCQGGYREPSIIVREATKLGYAIATVGDSINLEQPNSKTRRGRVGKEVAQTLTTSCNQATLEHDYKIRKLVPLECFRLMGFADEDYHKAKKALEDRFYKGNDRSNSQMYKMAGNSIVVNVLEAILRNLLLNK
mgnify:CR=1 FL=1